MSTRVNLSIDQGSDYVETIDVLDAQSGTAFDLTGHTAESHIRKSYYSTYYTPFVCNTTGTAGKVILNLSANTSANLEPGRYLYDVEITETATGKKTRVIEGLVTLTPGMTK